ncbi:MAG: cell wall-binding repeat-containing protein [Gracilibacteraceae bacterium]|jgi:hypothetical protein|nr:cell wall-binding repeat-containing protein [Gracilibacteraceae bacterium]
MTRHPGARKRPLLCFLLILLLVLMSSPAFAVEYDRIAGAERIATALNIAAQGWTEASAVIICPAETEHLVDSLVAAPLAGQENAPILLTAKTSLAPEVKARVQALGAGKVYTIGAVADSVVSELRAIPGVNVEKLSGLDRRATAAAVGAKLNGVNGTFVVGYNSLADAVSIASFAAANRYRVVLSSPGGQAPPAQLTAPVYLVGGSGSVADIAGAVRLDGDDRFALNAAVIAGLPFKTDQIYLASGVTLAEALIAAPLAARSGAAIALSDASGVSLIGTEAAKKFSAAVKITVIGDLSGVPQAAAEALAQAAAPAVVPPAGGGGGGGGYTAPRAYTNIPFDLGPEIAALNAKNTAYTTPAAADAGFTAADEFGADGVFLVPAAKPAADPAAPVDLYLNAMVAGNELVFQGNIAAAEHWLDGAKIASFTVSNGAFSFIPETVNAKTPVDEVIYITRHDTGAPVFKVHTLHEKTHEFVITGDAASEAGVYTFVTDDNVLYRVNTEGDIVYFRFYGPNTGAMKNFQAQDTADGRLYTYHVQTNDARSTSGYNSGMYVVMDANYQEIDYITLRPNNDPNHTHGEGYLDMHEFVMYGLDDWFALSYTQLKAENLAGKGIGGGNSAFVWACVFQEVRGGQVVREFNSVDYPELYDVSIESNDYAGSSASTPGYGETGGYQDYAHVNSLFINDSDDSFIASFRNLSAVIKFNRSTGNIVWILGGKANQFTLAAGSPDPALSDGFWFRAQHDAKYVPWSYAGNATTVSLFDNHTGLSNSTRLMEFTLDERRKTAFASLIVAGAGFDDVTGSSHWATHCASYTRTSAGFGLGGWGLNTGLMNSGDPRAIFTDFNVDTNAVSMELTAEKPGGRSAWSYRTYKNAD